MKKSVFKRSQIYSVHSATAIHLLIVAALVHCVGLPAVLCVLQQVSSRCTLISDAIVKCTEGNGLEERNDAFKDGTVCLESGLEACRVQYVI